MLEKAEVEPQTLKSVANCSAEIKRSCSGNSPDEIFLFIAALGPNGERIEHADSQRVLDGFILPVAKIAGTQNLHPDNRFSRGLHLL
jgi:hypothetical protein